MYGIIIVALVVCVAVTWRILDEGSFQRFIKRFPSTASFLGVAFCVLLLFKLLSETYAFSNGVGIVLIYFPVLVTLSLLLGVIFKRDKKTFNLQNVKGAGITALILSAAFYLGMSDEILSTASRVNTLIIYVACVICTACARIL